jgi:hypothetical protein
VLHSSAKPSLSAATQLSNSLKQQMKSRFEDGVTQNKYFEAGKDYIDANLPKKQRELAYAELFSIFDGLDINKKDVLGNKWNADIVKKAYQDAAKKAVAKVQADNRNMAIGLKNNYRTVQQVK